MLESCKEGGLPSDAALVDAANYLDGCYEDTRYPVHWPGGYTKEKAMQAREAAAKVRDAVYTALGI
ncbi:MAG: HEPN domain-containing protein [Nitrospirae bacterium]|nr:HEPN domain-containing protein [Nitrospirota bacterium]